MKTKCRKPRQRVDRVTWDQVKEFARQSPESRALVLEVLLLEKAKRAAKPQETK